MVVVSICSLSTCIVCSRTASTEKKIDGEHSEYEMINLEKFVKLNLKNKRNKQKPGGRSDSEFLIFVPFIDWFSSSSVDSIILCVAQCETSVANFTVWRFSTMQWMDAWILAGDRDPRGVYNKTCQYRYC